MHDAAMTKLASISLALCSLVGVAAADASFNDNNQTATVDCAKDPSVMIAGNNATITLTGICDNLMVSGNGAKVTGSAKKAMVPGNNNTVDLDQVNTLAVPGNGNTVTYKKPVDAKAKKVNVSNTGNKNTVTLKK